MPKILILDGNSLANRAFYALPMLTTADGKPTNALHGFMTMLLRLLLEQKPDYWVVAFDKTKATVRIEQYPDYKAHRKGTPEELKPQFDYLKEILAAFSVPMLEIAGYEADDIIATVADAAEARQLEVKIYTGDRDAWQLVSPLTTVFITRKGISETEVYTESVLFDKYKLRPAQFIDLKGLMGDTSDNIPGIPGVGEKTALKLLWEFESLESVLANANNISGKKLQESLKTYADQARLSKTLATIHHQVPVEFNIDQLAYILPDEQAFSAVLDKYGLRNVTRIWNESHLGPKNAGEAPILQPSAIPLPALSAASTPSETENSNAALLLPDLAIWPEQNLSEQDWLRQIALWQENKSTLCLSFTLTKGNPHWATLLNWGIATEGCSFSLEWESVTASAKIKQVWIQLLENPEVEKIVADSKSLYSVLLNQEISLQGLALDLSLAAYLLNPTRTKFDSLELVKEYYPGQSPFGDLQQEAAALMQVASCYSSALSELAMKDLLHNLEEPLSPVLARMEHTGIAVDTDKLKEFGRELSVDLSRLEHEIYELAGNKFNINSPQQLGQILFEQLGLPPLKKTKKGYSTDAETLEELRTSHPIIEKVLDYRQLSKLQSTYVNGLLAQIREGRTHTTFQQTVTATGRLSSTEPNLQNIPIRLEHGRLLRKVFHPTRENWLLLSADYSQIELRILAHYSQDRLLCESFALGQDVHTRTASEVFDVPMEEVNSDLRRKAKAVNFGLVYGLTDFGLSRDLGIPRREAKYYIDQYFSRYSGVKLYLEQAVAQAKENGEVRTLLNRLRRIPELRHPNRTQRQFGERIAMNSPIQGTAADIMKLAMLGVAEALKTLQAEILLQVHDELVLQVAPDQIQAVGHIIRREMENAFPLLVPLTVDCKYGPNWFDMSPLKLD